MKYVILGISVCLIAFNAHAQNMRDMSMPPETFGQEPEESTNTVINNGSGNNLGNFQPFMEQSQSPYGDRGYDRRGRYTSNDNRLDGFMASYCDPNFEPIISGRGALNALQQCTKEQKQKSCAEFEKLPLAVRNVLDDAISCASKATDEIGAATARDCSAHDSARMRLLKDYWRDQTVSESIVFLPDDILNASNNCIRGAR